MMTALLVAAGGAIGTLARYLVHLGMSRWWPSKIPFGTLTVNVLGSFAIGAVMAYFIARNDLGSPTRLALTTGVLGGFTTYSAFAYEVVALFRDRELGALFGYLALLFAASLVGCAAGIALGRSLAT